MKKTHHGFSILEILVVLVILAVLAALLIPAYTSYLSKSRRTDAIDTILTIQVAEEKYRVKNPSYSTSVYTDTDSIQKHYKISVTTTTDPNYYQITATAQGQQASDTNCGTFTLTYDNGTTTRTSSTATDCWN